MAGEKKGKVGTRGTKQIVEENVTTLKFYRNMSLVACSAFLLITLLLKTLTGTLITMTIISFGIHLGAYQFMKMISRPQLSENGSIIDSGTDLNMEGGIAEHVKDIIILTSGTQILALLSNWFWMLLLLGPVRAIYMLWGSVIKPWLSSKEDVDNPQVNEKKQKKMERRMKRMNSR
ncbi:unnamed protein product [Chironomus riparius]|uniref:Transmembrane protein 208 n=1 Tax=Chironomus riparius TaxID=315576 RepID=A0A9N9RHS2_9DIPT|nr:unnamed protein product [Chironomus riparius]